MKRVIIVFLLFFISKSFGQNLVEYQVDEDFFVNLPTDIEISETSQQKVVKGFIENDVVIITKTIQKDTIVTIENEQDLLKYYKGAQEGLLGQSKGILLKKEIIEIKGLKVLNVRFKMQIDNEEKVLDSFMFFLNNHTYSLVFIHSFDSNENFKLQREKIISSIKFRNGLNIENQFNKYEESSTAYKLGEITGKIFFFVLVIVGVIFLFRKVKK